MRQACESQTPDPADDPDMGDKLLSLDGRWLSPDVYEEVVLIAGDGWIIWTNIDGGILDARRGPDA